MRRRQNNQNRPNGVELRLYRLRLVEWPGIKDWDRYQAWLAARQAWEDTHGPFERGGTYPEHRDADQVPDAPFNARQI